MYSITTFSARLNFTQTNGVTNAEVITNVNAMVTAKIQHQEEHQAIDAEVKSLNKAVIESVINANFRFHTKNFTQVTILVRGAYAAMNVASRITSMDSDLNRVQIAHLLNGSATSIFLKVSEGTILTAKYVRPKAHMSGSNRI